MTDDSLPAGLIKHEDNEVNETSSVAHIYGDRYNEAPNSACDEMQPQHTAGSEGNEANPLIEDNTLSPMRPSARVYPDQQRKAVEARAVDRDRIEKVKRDPPNRACKVTQTAAKGLDKRPKGEVRKVDGELLQREGPGEAWGNMAKLGPHHHQANFDSSCSTHRRPSRGFH